MIGFVNRFAQKDIRLTSATIKNSSMSQSYWVSIRYVPLPSDFLHIYSERVLTKSVISVVNFDCKVAGKKCYSWVIELGILLLLS